MMTINFDTITNNYEVIKIYLCDQNCDEILFKKNRYKFIFIIVFQIGFNVYLPTSLHNAIWLMNIHEQNHP